MQPGGFVGLVIADLIVELAIDGDQRDGQHDQPDPARIHIVREVARQEEQPAQHQRMRGYIGNRPGLETHQLPRVEM